MSNLELFYDYSRSISNLPASQMGNPLGRGTKRRREVEDDIKVSEYRVDSSKIPEGFLLLYLLKAGSMEDIDKLLSTPKKKKLTTTSEYIYRNLFQVENQS